MVLGGMVVRKNGLVEGSTSGCEKVASVASMAPRYHYHCVSSRMDLLWMVLGMSLSGTSPCPEVRNLGCVGEDINLVIVDAWVECRRL